MTAPALSIADLDDLRTKLAETTAAMIHMATLIRSDSAYDPARRAWHSLKWRETNLQLRIQRLGYAT